MRRKVSPGIPQTKRKFYLKYLYEIKMVITILVLASGVFLFFKSFFDLKPNSLTTEILAALLGSILTVMITMLLIRQQGTMEQAYESAVASKTKIFEKKLFLFQSFIEAYVGFAADGKLDNGELAKLEKLAITISLFTRKIVVDDEANEVDLGEALCQFILQLQFCGIIDKPRSLDKVEQENYEKFLDHMNEAGVTLEVELGRPLSFARILRMMEAELGVDKLDAVGEKEVPNEMAHLLLAYRGYRDQDQD